MGYSTYFTGKIKIVPEPTASKIAFIKEYYDETDDRLDLEFSKDLSHLQHNGAEKSRLDEVKMQEFIDACVSEFPDIKFLGILKASGEDYDDRWELIVENNQATREEKVLTGPKVECPYCNEEFNVIEDD